MGKKKREASYIRYKIKSPHHADREKREISERRSGESQRMRRSAGRGEKKKGKILEISCDKRNLVIEGQPRRLN